MTRIQVGDVLQESNGDELHVYVHQYADEEHDEIEIKGDAAMISFDPSTPQGRTQVNALIARLQEALALHGQSCEKLYGQLKVGDWCIGIRQPVGNDERCPSELPHPEHGSVQCSRTAHDDPHHVTVDEHYDVTAVVHLVTTSADREGVPARRPACTCPDNTFDRACPFHGDTDHRIDDPDA